MMFYDNKCYKELADRLCVKYALRDSQVKAMLSSEDAKACLDYCNRMKTAMKDRLKPVTEVEGEIKLVSSKIINFFRVENVIFQGKNGECIPINVYSPLDDSKKYPAVVVSVGHWREGKRLEVNQRLCQHLCAEGMVVAIYDPMYQGERNPYTDQMKIAFNPSPLNERISMCDLNLVDLLFVNEIEGAAISSGNTCLEILHMLNEKYPEMSVVLTLGGNGSLYKDKTGQIYTCGIYKTAVVDTTAAGDTFTGYFISEYIKSDDAQISLEKAAIASGLSVSVKGASPSVPKRDMVDSIDRDVLSRCELF